MDHGTSLQILQLLHTVKHLQTYTPRYMYNRRRKEVIAQKKDPRKKGKRQEK